MKKSNQNETNKSVNGTRVLDEGVAPGRDSAVVQQGGPGRYQTSVAQNYVEKADGRGGGEKVQSTKEKRRVRKKDGGRGKIKPFWTNQERRVLWECYIRSGGKKSGGYMQKVKEMWDGRDLSVRGIPSLVAQLKQIETNSLLTVVERREIERRVLRDTVEEVEENLVDFMLEEVEDGNEIGSEGKVDEGGDTVEVVKEDLVDLVLKELEDDNELGGMVTVDEGDDTVKFVDGNYVDLVLKELEDDNELEEVMADDTVEVVKGDFVVWY